MLIISDNCRHIVEETQYKTKQYNGVLLVSPMILLATKYSTIHCSRSLVQKARRIFRNALT